MELYRNSEIVLCCGQGAWEQEMENSMHQMEAIFADKHIDVWIDFWGYDVRLPQIESLVHLHPDTAYVYGLSASLVVAEHPCKYLYIRCMSNILIDNYLSILYYIFI